MNTTEIRTILHSIIDSKFTTDVFACDQLHLLDSDQFAVIVNTDPSEMSGTHWLAIYKEAGEDTIEFFDSFAMSIMYYNERIVNFVNEHGKFRRESCIQIQSNFSATCGHFCIYYLMQRTNGFDLNSILNEFSQTNLIKNDQKVQNFIKSNFVNNTFSSFSDNEGGFRANIIRELIVQCSKIVDLLI